jgi:hypothetical protein
MSAVSNERVRGKKIEMSSEDRNLISKALSIIWQKTDKNVESYFFKKDKVRLVYKKNKGRTYFDLFDELSLENEVS